LEHHPNPATHEFRWCAGRINVQVAELYPTLHAAAKMVVETVDGPEESRFAAPRRPDQSGHLQRGYVEVDPTHGDVVAEADRDVLET
jgi:crotonobetainyl-CoA:carnitine CoA-transferase CaiB-like acyl-CoA transferase